MCLIVYKIFNRKVDAQKYASKPFIAKEDITVYKRLIIWNNDFHSPYKKFKFEKGYEYTEHKPFTGSIIGSYRFGIVIESGFHAYTKKQNAINRCKYNEIIVEMIIPKGAKYFLGEGNEIVTNKIIFY